MLFLHQWSRCFHTPELNDSSRSHGYKTLNCSSCRECPLWLRTQLWVSTRDRWYIWSRIPLKERSLFSFHCFVQVVLILYTVQDGTPCSFGQGTTSVLPFLPEQAVSEKRFIAFLGEVHLHCWCCIVVRHGVHVHIDVFCSLFPWFAVSFFLLELVLLLLCLI